MSYRSLFFLDDYSGSRCATRARYDWATADLARVAYRAGGCTCDSGYGLGLGTLPRLASCPFFARSPLAHSSPTRLRSSVPALLRLRRRLARIDAVRVEHRRRVTTAPHT